MAEAPLPVDRVLAEAEAALARGEALRARQIAVAVLSQLPLNGRARKILDATAHVASRASAEQAVRALVGLIQQGRAREAVTEGERIAERQPGNAMVRNLIGGAHLSLGENEEAAERFREAVAINQGFFVAQSNLGIALARLGRIDEARAAFEAALMLKPDYAEAQAGLGDVEAAAGNLDAAIEALGRAVALKPNLASAHASLGTALRRAARAADAVEAYRRSLALRARHAETVCNLGVALNDLDRRDDAIEAYREALSLNPALPEAFENLCDALERKGDLDALSAVIEAGRGAGQPAESVALWQGVLAERRGETEAARAALEQAAPGALGLRASQIRAERLGRVRDRLDDAAGAFAAFSEANRLGASLTGARGRDAAGYRAEVAALRAAWEGARPAFAPAGPSADAPRLAFMVGFPRSGTTLLDTMLRGNKAIAVVEEQPMVEAALTALGTAPTPDALAALTAEDVADLRAAYLGALAGQVPAGERPALVIDKLPLNIVRAGLIHRMFPEAPFVLSLRHPCDCVLSAFMQTFRLNDAMANFLALDTAAELYDGVMGLWSAYAEALPLTVEPVRYEDLIAEPEAVLRRLAGTLGVEFEPAMLDHQATAAARGRIATPSYSQVARPLHAEAEGRWRRYREPMAPVLDILAPWAARWGYDL